MNTENQIDSNSVHDGCVLIVTDGDKVLCENCHRDEFVEWDPRTHFYSCIKHGVCDSCGLIIAPTE